MRLWLRLLGDFEACLPSGKSVLPISKKARGLLALVAAQMPQPLRREFAAGLLWSSKPKDHAANSFRQALRELQLSLLAAGQPPLLVTGSGRLSFAPDCVWIDIHQPALIKWKPESEGAMGPLLLCQNLQGLDPAFDAHLERMWKNLVFQQAFVPVAKDVEQHYRDLYLPPWEQQAEAPDSPPALLGDKQALLPSSAVASISVPERGEPVRQPAHAPDLAPGQGWRIAILPFRYLGVPIDSGLSLSMAEEVASAMARFRMPRLTATASFWDQDAVVPDALLRAKELKLEYVIAGTIQSSGTHMRVTVSLLDLGMEYEMIWSCRFDGSTEDLFGLQDLIASRTVAQVDPELMQRHQFRGESVRTPNSASYQAVLTAIQWIYRPDKTRFLRARDLLTSAIETDPDYAAAHAWLAYWYIMGVGQGWVDTAPDLETFAGIAAEKAVVLDPLDARGITIAGHVKSYLLHDVDSALALHARAIALNPYLQVAWAMSSFAHTYDGHHQVASDHAQTGIDLSPSDPHVFFIELAAALANFFLKRLDRAESFATSVLERKPGHAAALRLKLAILGHLGNSAGAKVCFQRLQAADNRATISGITSRAPFRQADVEYYREGLRRAGVPE